MTGEKQPEQGAASSNPEGAALMTTAKPQHMAGQGDSSDDLIAELAKLMAQDAQTERPEPAPRPQPPAAAPPPAAPQPFSLRIPGAAEGPSVPVMPPAPRVDLGRPSEPAAAAPRQEPGFAPVASRPVPPQPAAPTPPGADAIEPFSFDFDLGKRSQPQPAPAQAAPVVPQPAPVQAAAPVAPQPTPIAPRPASVAPSPVDLDEHDTIADLIAAELLGETPAPAAVPMQSAPPAETIAPRPVVAAPSQPVRTEEPARVDEPVAQRGQPEGDSFKIPPVFGLGSRVTPVAPAQAPAHPHASSAPAHPSSRVEPPAFSMGTPSIAPSMGAPRSAPVVPPVAPTPMASADDTVGLDPIDEIESLIGRAVRVELDSQRPTPTPPPAPSAPLASPALRSLATPTIPVPSQPAAPSRGYSGADEAILAAAAATGAQIGWVEPPEELSSEPEPEPRRSRAPRAGRFSRALIGPFVAVALLLAAGLGLYWVLGLGSEPGPAPLLTADAEPVKETPTVDTTTAPQQSVVFNEIDGVVPGAEEQLVSRDQADLNEVTQVTTPDLSEEGLANRKVRTVTVRPDGTIVSGDESVAGAAILPVDRPNVPAVPGTATASPELVAATTPAAALPETPVAATPTPVAVPPVAPGSTVPAVDANGTPIPGKTAVVPLNRPSTFRNPVASAPAPVNAVVGAPAAPVAAAPPAGTPAPAYVQLSSQPTEAAAVQSANEIVRRFGSLFGGASLEVQQTEVAGVGTRYRVRVPAASAQSANQICASVKSSGGDCFVTN